MKQVVDHDVKLAGHYQHADARQHAMHDRRRHRSEPLAQLQPGPLNLKQAGEEHDEQAANDAGRRRGAGCHGNAHAEWKGDEQRHQGGDDIVPQAVGVF